MGGHMYIVAFRRDCRSLLAGGNGVGYLWNTLPPNLPKKEPAELWKDLTGTDPIVADRAFCDRSDRRSAVRGSRLSGSHAGLLGA